MKYKEELFITVECYIFSSNRFLSAIVDMYVQPMNEDCVVWKTAKNMFETYVQYEFTVSAIWVYNMELIASPDIVKAGFYLFVKYNLMICTLMWVPFSKEIVLYAILISHRNLFHELSYKATSVTFIIFSFSHCDNKNCSKFIGNLE
jgi:hypothetical protein